MQLCDWPTIEDGHSRWFPYFYKKENGYDLCKICIQEFIRICTCNKEFIVGKPKQYALGKKNSVISLFDLPDPIPDFFYTQITGNLYHILGCRGCQHTEEISIKDNFKEALQASITSCIYQKVEEDNKIFYEYLSDSLNEDFENYCISKGLELGNPAKIVIDNTSENPNPNQSQ